MDDSLEIGNFVKIKKNPNSSHGLPYKIIGFSQGGNLVFLQPKALVNRSRSEHAISWFSDDLVKVS